MVWVKERITDDGDKRFVACYRDPEGRQRSAGTYASRRAAERASNREEAKVREGAWHDHSRGEVTFPEYVETVWLPSKQVETSTLAAYGSYLDKHFIPTFGRRPMGKILPSEVQRWVTTATESGLSAASGGKYHTMLSSVFERALVDRVVTFNPCAHTELPKKVKKKARTLTPEEYDAILASLPAQHRLMVETAINTGLRWGELIALKPRHLDLIKRTLTVEETVVEVSIKNSPTGQRMLTKPYAKDNEARTMELPPDLVGQLTAHIAERGLGTGDLLFSTRDGTPISRNTFRTRIWLPAFAGSGVDFDVRVHDLRHAHASWLLAPRRRLRPQVRDGPHGPRPNHHHPEIPTRPARRRPEEPRRSGPHPPNQHSRHQDRHTRPDGSGGLRQQPGDLDLDPDAVAVTAHDSSVQGLAVLIDESQAVPRLRVEGGIGSAGSLGYPALHDAVRPDIVRVEHQVCRSAHLHHARRCVPSTSGCRSDHGSVTSPGRTAPRSAPTTPPTNAETAPSAATRNRPPRARDLRLRAPSGG
jgi:integrase